MKKYICVLCMICIALSALADAKEKLFKEAVKNGPDNSFCFHIKNSKTKDVDVSDMKRYVEEQGYMVMSVSDIMINHFGTSKTVLDEMVFYKPNDLADVVLQRVTFCPKSDLRTQGSCFIVIDGNSNPTYATSSIWHAKLKRYDNVQWTGDVEDGLLTGQGSGVIMYSDTHYLTLKGTFDHGLPISQIFVRTINVDPKRNASSSDVIEYNGMIVDRKPIVANQELCEMNLDTKDTTLAKALGHRMKSFYKENVDSLEIIYKEAQTINISNYASFSPYDGHTDKVKKFIEIYERYNYDPRNALPKAREIIDVYRIWVGLKKKIRENYYGMGLWSILSGNYEWFDDSEKEDRTIFSESEASAKRLKNNSAYGFSKFGADALPIIEKKYDDFTNKLIADYNDYSRKFNNKAAEQKENKREIVT